MGCGSSSVSHVQPSTFSQTAIEAKGKRTGSPTTVVTSDIGSEKRKRVEPGDNSYQIDPDVTNKQSKDQSNENLNKSDENAPVPVSSDEIIDSDPHDEKIEVEVYQTPKRKSVTDKENFHQTSIDVTELDNKEDDKSFVQRKPLENIENGTIISESDTRTEHSPVTHSTLEDPLPTDLNNNVSTTMMEKDTRDGRDKILRKADLFSDVSIFAEVDEHALEVPEDKTLSMEDLAQYLIAPFDTDLMKVRALWRWITANIEYDVDTFFGKSSSSEKVEAFSSRKGVCDGYASIAQDLFSLCGIESVKVSGWAKGYYYKPGKKISETAPNHAWNAVKLDGQWWLCDTTWGAGYVNSDRNFVWEYTEHYFLTDPDEFIFDHFPSDPQWQLLDSAVSMEEYESWAKFSKHFFMHQLKPLSHKGGIINVPIGSIDVSLGYISGTDFTLDLIKNDSEKNMKECCFHFSSNGIAHFLVKLPEVGLYTLKLYARKSSSETNSYSSVCSYQLNCTKALTNWTPFPSYKGSWKEGFVLHEPLSGCLKKGSTANFRIATPENIVEMFVCINCDDEWLTMTQDEDKVWEVSATISDSSAEVKVLANDLLKPDSGYSVLLSFSIVK